MKLKCLGSGSSGNCYLLENAKEALVIEAGGSFKEVKRALNFNISKIVGVIVSHSHGDHVSRVHEYENAGISVFKPYEGEMERQIHIFGDFVVHSFPLVHDVPCFGFLINHPDMGYFLYASDTEYIKYRFSGSIAPNYILVEANYSADLIDPLAENRTHVLTGHMELQTTLEFLRKNRSPALQKVILCHLSSNNADPVRFCTVASRVVDCPVYIAEKGLDIDMSLVPF